MSGTQAKIVRRNLEVLDKEKKKLFSAADKHLAEVFQVGQQWIEEKQAHHMTFKEIKNYIDDAIELIMEKAESFTDTDETQEPLASSQPESLVSTSLPGYSSPVPVASGIISVVDEDTMKKILARIDNIQETVSSLQTATDSVTDKQKSVEKKVEENSKEMSDFQDQHARRVTDVEKQMKKLSKKQKEEANQVNTKLGKMETNITLLSSGVNVEKLDTLAKDFDVITSRIKEIETVGTKKHIGFTARMPSSPFPYPMTSHSVCKGFIDVLSNLGGHYGPTTGVFTASLDGVYVAYLAIQQCNDGYIEATVRQSQVGKAVDGNGIEVCRVMTNGDLDLHSMSGLGVVKMKVGDRLYVWVDESGRNPRLLHTTSFSCFLIG